jgi:L-aminoadipate-semialdehyde dehydrogenase
MVKGCVQLGLAPNMNNTINMVPVDHVALTTTMAAIAPLPSARLSALHVTARPLPTFNEVLGALAEYGFPIEQCEYLVWRRKLEQHVMETQDNALYPLLHFVLDDLPTSTKAPELDDRNSRDVLKPHTETLNMTVDAELMGKYLAWLVKAGFLPIPTGKNPKKLLPDIGDGVVKAAGRSGI